MYPDSWVSVIPLGRDSASGSELSFLSSSELLSFSSARSEWQKDRSFWCNPVLVQAAARAMSSAKGQKFYLCTSLWIYLSCHRHFQTCHFNSPEFFILFGISITMSLNGEGDIGRPSSSEQHKSHSLCLQVS